jgi:hypothetical protein
MRYSQMWHSNRWMIAVLLLIICLQLAGCAQTPTNSASQEEGPAKVEPVPGKNLSRVILTQQATKRIGIETASISDAQVRGQLRQVVPYSAVIYDLHGETWVYTNPESFTYVRETISIDFIDGDLAVLSKGPPSGTTIVTVGVPELYGTESDVGE